MNLEGQIQLFLHTHLSEKEIAYTKEVHDMIRILQPIYGLDPDQAKIASLLHHAASHLTEEQMTKLLQRREKRLMDRLPESHWIRDLLIGPASAWIALEYLDVRDDATFSAIREHTMLFQHPSMLAKCLFIASILLQIEQDDSRGNFLAQQLFCGNIKTVLRVLNDREIRSLNRTGTFARLSRLSNPGIT